MENARLMTETREALEQQTATAEVLQVINSSPGDLAPVFDAMLEKATRLCDAAFGILWTYDGEMLARRRDPRRAAAIGRIPADRGRTGRPEPHRRVLQRRARRPHRRSRGRPRPTGTDDPVPRAIVDLGGVRTLLIVPLRKDDAAARGTSPSIARRCGRFPTSRSRCCRTSRRRRSSRWRTRGCSANCASARAISKNCSNTRPRPATCCKVISRSTFDLQPVLDTLVRNGRAAVRRRYGGHREPRRRDLSRGGDVRVLARVRRVRADAVVRAGPRNVVGADAARAAGRPHRRCLPPTRNTR